MQANQEYEFLYNFRLVQNAFDQVQVATQIPMADLVKRRLCDNLEFGCWFRRLYERNYKKLVRHGYDPVAARGNQFIGLGPYRAPTKNECRLCGLIAVLSGSSIIGIWFRCRITLQDPRSVKVTSSGLRDQQNRQNNLCKKNCIN
ncbi:microtubule-associated protein RP/EB family member 1-like [Drosophila serrata]|uniref:microtubule-associated protein RP/EB family member 1-like n=1 Tax=Drosophila serrata TaxID=7274 RepID=UPI000A1D074D|nr:microtubule-associated protein RP/EB family member 1-like [Drosophila serrata]